MSRSRIGVLFVTVLAVALGGCPHHIGGDFPARFAKDVNLTAPLSGITGIDVQTNVGEIVLQAGDVGECAIAVHIKTKDHSVEQAEAWAEQVKITTETQDQTLVVRANKPDGLADNQLEVGFKITAPRELNVDCTTQVGAVRVTDFAGRIHAQTDVGSVVCKQARGEAELLVDVGDVRLEYAVNAPPAINAQVSTDVGNIFLVLPSDVSARIDATTDVGSIHTQRPITVTGTIGKRLSGTLGQGEGTITLRVDVGSITVQ